MFGAYLELGFDHILDFNGYDHILFVIALCAVYRPSQWRNILILVTAFTIGHSVTLALAALEIVSFPSDVIEFLIPLTIFLTAVFNIYHKGMENRKIMLNYFLALFFGFIHGLGFSNYFRALLGREENILNLLFPFNLGVELGQIVIVMITMGIGYIVLNLANAKQRDWNLFISGAAAGISIILMKEAKFW